MNGDPRVTLLLAVGDDDLVIGHRHSSWTGVAPHLEEDLAFSSIAQDEIGHAVVWYSIAADLVGADPDTLGLGREPAEYRNAVLVERPNGDWGYTLARHFLYDVFEDVRLRALAESSFKPVANATGALLREERYHLLHSRAWLQRLAHGPVEGRQRLADGLVAALGESAGLYEQLPGEDELVADGVLPCASGELGRRWREVVHGELTEHGLEHVLDGSARHSAGEFVATSSGEYLVDDGDGERRAAPGGGLGGRHGRHSEDFAELWDEMTGTYRAHPGARW